MTDELVNAIVQQVMVALRERGVVEGSGGAGGGTNGTGKGVLSTALAKPQAAARGGGGPSVRSASGELSDGEGSRGPQKVFLTAEMLERRLAAEAGDGRVIELAAHEFLTPAALDLADERRLKVTQKQAALPQAPRAGDGVTPSASTAIKAACDPAARNDGSGAGLGLVVERPDEKVRSVLAGVSHDRLPVIDYSQTGCWIANTRLLCDAVLSRAVCRGVVILPYAADAMVLTNKFRGIRAVQGIGADSVAAAVRHFAPNVLIVEHALCTYHEMRSMLRLFARPAGGAPEAEVLMRTIEELERQ